MHSLQFFPLAARITFVLAVVVLGIGALVFAAGRSTEPQEVVATPIVITLNADRLVLPVSGKRNDAAGRVEVNEHLEQSTLKLTLRNAASALLENLTVTVRSIGDVALVVQQPADVQFEDASETDTWRWRVTRLAPGATQTYTIPIAVIEANDATFRMTVDISRNGELLATTESQELTVQQ